jgi:hypothetical protein
MKRIFILLVFFVIFVNLFSQQLDLQKNDDLFVAQMYQQRDNIIIEDGHLFALSVYGLEIYEIGINGELNLQSRLPITISNSITKKDNYVYIASSKFSSVDQWGKVYQINVEDKQNPIIVQELGLEYFTWPLQIYGNILNVVMYDLVVKEYHNLFYSLPNLTLITQFQNYFDITEKINDTTLIRRDEFNQFSIIDISDISNPIIIGSGDISSVHPLISIQRVTAYQDTILIFSVNDIISIWDINDPNNWQYLAQYQPASDIFGDYKPLIVESSIVLVEYEYIELIGLSDINNPQQLSILPANYNYIASRTLYIAKSDENLYITTNHNGIQCLSLTNNTLSFEYENIEYYPSLAIEKCENFLIFPYHVPAFKYYDFTNPTDPVDMGEIIPNYYPDTQISGNKWAVFNAATLDYAIYDISNIGDPVITNQIEFDNHHYCHFDLADDNSIYFVDYEDDYSYHFKKYDISQPGSNDLVFDISLSHDIIDWLVNDGHAYFIEYVDTYERRLYIYDNLNTNPPNLCNTIENFVPNPNRSLLKMVDGFLVVYTLYDDYVSPNNRTKFFNLDVPDQPEFVYSVNAYGEPFTKDDLVFITSDYQCYVFEKPDNSVIGVEPLADFYDISTIEDIYFIEYNNINYLLLCEGAHIGVYEYEYTPASAENELPVSKFKLSNHPNPFNPSTRISFNVPQSSAFATIEIFNIKGQKVNTLPVSESQSLQVSVTWDGTDQNNHPVGSGIYFYQLKVDGEAVASRKCLLLK